MMPAEVSAAVTPELVRLEGKTLPYVAHLMTAEERAAVSHKTGVCGVAALDQGVGVGFLLFLQHSGALRLQSVMVDPAFRRLGVGSELVRALVRLARSRKLSLVVPFTASGFCDPLYRFFASLHLFALVRQSGFTAEVERPVLEEYCRTWEALTQRPTESPFEQRPGLLYRLRTQVEPAFPEVAQDLLAAPGIFDRCLSRCVVRGEEIRAVSLIQREGAAYHLRFLCAQSDCGSLAMVALAGSVRRFLDETEGGGLTMTVATPQSKQILDKLCRTYRIQGRIYLGHLIGTET